MREIKFRIWDIEDKCFLHWKDIWYSVVKVPPNTINNNQDKEIILPYISMAILNNKNYTVNQFTGIKDDLGKEIYEGDILGNIQFDEIPIPIGSVEFYGSCFGVTIDCDPKFLILDELINIKVIGNIYENPELIKNLCEK